MQYQHGRCNIDMHDAALPWMMQYQHVWCNTETYLTYWHVLIHYCYGYCLIIIDDAILRWIMQYRYGWCNTDMDDAISTQMMQIGIYFAMLTCVIYFVHRDDTLLPWMMQDCHGWCNIEMDDATPPKFFISSKILPLDTLMYMIMIH